jgi:DNA-binding MarR family transcriptional regulator
MKAKTKMQPIAVRGAPLHVSARPTQDFVGYLLVKAAARLRAATAVALAPLQLAPQEFGLLNQLIMQPALTQAQLGGLLGIDRTTIVALLDRQAAMGWIERSPDASDRRVYRISSTSKGRALHAKALAEVVRVESQLLDCLNPAQTTALQSALAALCQAPAPE